MRAVNTRALALAGRELKTYFRDTQALFFSLALPLVLIVLMVASFGGQTDFNATAYVVNLDQGAAGAELVERLRAVPEITVELLDEAAADRRLGSSDITNVVVIEPDFTARLQAGQMPGLRLRLRGTGGAEGQIIDSYATALAMEVAGRYQMAREVAAALAAMGRPVSEAEARAKVAEIAAETAADPPVNVAEEAVGALVGPLATFLPGLVTMFTLFAISLTSVTLVEERRRGTLERLMTTRLSRGEFLMGTWLGSLVRGLFQVAVLFGLGWAIFRMFSLSTLASVMTFSVVSVAAVAGIGLLIAAISRTSEQANWTGVFFTMIMSVLGGSFFDLSGATGILAVLTRLTYNFWANDGFRRIIIKGESLVTPAVAKDMAVLGAIGVVGAVLAFALFRVRGDDK